MDLTNRIIKTELIRWREAQWLQGGLKAISKTSFGKLKESLLKNSFIQPFNVTVKKNKTWILDGHHRKLAMEELAKEGHRIPERLPANFIDCKDLKEARDLVLVYSSIYARADEETLYEYIHTNQLSFEALKPMIDLPDLNLGKFERGWMTDDVTEEPTPEPPTAPQSKLGDIYELGEHRLICGDATKEGDVKELLGGEAMKLMVTDPPYGVNYDPAWRTKADFKHLGEYTTEKVSNDDIFEWYETFALISAQVAYVWHAGIFEKDIVLSLEKAGYQIVSQIIWSKKTYPISRGDYHWRHEPCVYAVKKGAKHNWQGARDQATVWEIDGMNIMGRSKDEDDERQGHSTQKPIECMARPIRNNSKKGETVVDPFLGSGTTLIACEKLKRRCFALELDPKYVDVSIERYVKASGNNKIKKNGKPFTWQSAVRQNRLKPD